MRLPELTAKTLPLVFLVGVVIFTSYFLTQFVETSQTTQNIIANTGYAGPILLALLFGLSVIIPFPPGALTPVFTASGLYLPLVLVTLTIGTTIADLLGYYLGRFSKQHIETKYPRLYKTIKKLRYSRPIYIQLFVLLMTGFIPFPNESWIIPFGMIGIRLHQFILPMILGTLLNHTMVALGIVTLFNSVG